VLPQWLAAVDAGLCHHNELTWFLLVAIWRGVAVALRRRLLIPISIPSTVLWRWWCSVSAVV